MKNLNPTPLNRDNQWIAPLTTLLVISLCD
jgi:hypothetical protein